MENKKTLEKDPCNFCGKTLREQMKGCNEITCYRQFLHKQETLKEAVANSWWDYEHVEGHLYSTTYKNGFKEGAKWQAERMYNGKAPEMLEMLKYFVENNMLSIVGEEKAKQLIKEATEI